MKIKFRLGDIKYSYEGELNELYNHFSQLLSSFSRYQADFLSKLYSNVPPGFLSHDMGKLFQDYLHMKKAKNGYNPEDPNSMPANGHDIYNYVARYGLANCQIQAVIHLDGQLDFDRLSHAVRLSIDMQPVLGSRFIENEPPYWKRISNLDKTDFCSKEETENPEASIKRFLETQLDMDHDAMIKVRLIRSGQYDTLCLKLNHACCDGGAVKEYIGLLSQIYSDMDADGTFTAEPVKRNRKDQDRLFSSLGIADPEKEWIAGSEITKATWPFPWKHVQTDRYRIAVCKLPPEQFEEMVLYSKARAATINDLVLTAYYRAMAQTGNAVYDEAMEIPVTVDLRRYLPDRRTEALRNFSGSEFTKLTLVPNESFEDTLSRVISMMKEIKNNRPGLQSAIGLERIEKMAFSETLAYYKMVAQWPYSCSDKCAPVLSNLGFVAEAGIKFGETEVPDAYIVPPVVRAPSFLLMVSTYNGIMTLAAGIYESTVPLEKIETLLNRVKTELIDGCQL